MTELGETGQPKQESKGLEEQRSVCEQGLCKQLANVERVVQEQHLNKRSECRVRVSCVQREPHDEKKESC